MKSLSSCRFAGIKYCRLFVFCAMPSEDRDADHYGSKYCDKVSGAYFQQYGKVIQGLSLARYA